MAQKKGLGKVPGMGIWDGPGNITKKIPSAWDFANRSKFAILGWISGRSNQVICGKNLAIISSASECFHILTRLF